jgi:TatD DNase family protein
LTDSKTNIELAKKYKYLYPACGIHPQDTSPDLKLNISEQLNLLEESVKNNINLVAAIGECGLDLSPAPEGERERSLSEQMELFLGQIDIAQKYNLPIIIHARKAVDETIDVLKKYPKLSGVFHCYAGGKKRVQKVLGLGPNWFFGLDGNITYEDGLAEVVKIIPTDRLVLETDSPFLTPLPFRGQTNQPKYIKYIYEKVAEIWGKNFSETEKIIDENAKQLFPTLNENR